MMENLITQSTLLTLFFAICAIVISWAASIKGYFSLPAMDEKGPNVYLRHVVAIFFIFLVVFLFIAPLVFHRIILNVTTMEGKVILSTIIQLFIFLSSALLIFLYTLTQNRQTMLSLWKDNSFSKRKSLRHDVLFGIVSWFVAIFPVLAVMQLFELFTLLIVGETDKTQLAVQFLQIAKQYPLSFCLALLSTLVTAPLLEEFLFRGVLQSWLRRALGTWQAIFVSAFFFALFHYAPSQGVVNITLFASLFVFGSYLGFVYEKTRSLFSPLFLHVTFNFISVMRILFIQE